MSGRVEKSYRKSEIPIDRYFHTSDSSSTDNLTDHLQIIPTVHYLDLSRQIDDLYDLYELAHVAGWEP